MKKDVTTHQDRSHTNILEKTLITLVKDKIIKDKMIRYSEKRHLFLNSIKFIKHSFIILFRNFQKLSFFNFLSNKTRLLSVFSFRVIVFQIVIDHFFNILL